MARSCPGAVDRFHGQLFRPVREHFSGVGVLNGHAVESNRMNAIMKTLTAASIILLVPNLIAAVFGMNFEQDMPHYGFHESLVTMIILVISLTLYFKQKRWI